MFSHVERPAILVDADRRIVAGNRQGFELLSTASFITQLDGQLTCTDGHSQEGLVDTLAGVIGATAEGPVHTTLHLPKASPARRGTARQLGVTMTRLVTPRQEAGGEPPAVLTLLTFENVPLSSLDLAHNAMRCFGLTAAQAKVAVELAGGKTIKQIAFYSGVSVNTVRHHVKAIFAKTGTNRQVELVQVLSQLAQRGAGDDAFESAPAASSAAMNGSHAGGNGGLRSAGGGAGDHPPH